MKPKLKLKSSRVFLYFEYYREREMIPSINHCVYTYWDKPYLPSKGFSSVVFSDLYKNVGYCLSENDTIYYI